MRPAAASRHDHDLHVAIELRAAVQQLGFAGAAKPPAQQVGELGLRQSHRGGGLLL
jgi:hypothetical protein